MLSIDILQPIQIRPTLKCHWKPPPGHFSSTLCQTTTTLFLTGVHNLNRPTDVVSNGFSARIHYRHAIRRNCRPPLAWLVSLVFQVVIRSLKALANLGLAVVTIAAGQCFVEFTMPSWTTPIPKLLAKMKKSRKHSQPEYEWNTFLDD